MSAKPGMVRERTHRYTRSHEQLPPELERPELSWPERETTKDDVDRGGGLKRCLSEHGVIGVENPILLIAVGRDGCRCSMLRGRQ